MDLPDDQVDASLVFGLSAQDIYFNLAQLAPPSRSTCDADFEMSDVLWAAIIDAERGDGGSVTSRGASNR